MNLHDVVVLKVDLPQDNLKKGMRGVVVAMFDRPEVAYEVEFCDDNGATIAEVALTPDLVDAL